MVALTVLACALLMILAEARWTGRRFPKVAGWHARALSLNAIQAAVVLVAGVAWEPWMQAHQLLPGSRLGAVGGAVVGYVVLTFVYYWWHRARHESDFLWRWVHQTHHSPQRLEIVTSFYKHPIELVLNGLLSSAMLYLVLGVSPAAASGAVLVCGLAELVYHWNVATPRWLGFVFQRPEMHCVHHREGSHTHNYGDLPIWDMLFGTFDNPARFDGQCGFGDKEHRLAEMLIGIDVNRRDEVAR
jgi:sterol desaturase/sphingolipid hydroxylase (fatty acid hydroxylase superfamily)